MVGSIASSPSVDLSALPPPVSVDTPDYETRLAGKLARLISLMPEFSALVESDPAMILLESDSYDETVLVQSFADTGRALLLAFATGANLDHLGAIVDCPRLVVTPATDTAAAVMEKDAPYKLRIQLAPHRFSVAGPELAYKFHAMSAHGDVADVSAESPEPEDIRSLVLDVLAAHAASDALVADMTAALDAADWPGDVNITVMSNSGTGVPPAAVVAAVDSALQGDVRPMTDRVRVRPAERIGYDIEARIYPFAGPDQDLILETALAKLDAYLKEARRLGRDIEPSAHTAALFVGNVARVELISPAVDGPIDLSQFADADTIDVSIGGTVW
ncbi:baseplate J/gp47 family protein [Novosphingobium sp. ST904]|uniref:baseplate assembly protein n=1 Tax=Novosphingobium sp. ST904 TaxID=1684385 RepID=UPI0010E1E1FE|nr:baseplate J/gp47 family protein [Novosphingobium sp. ST904]TCM43324.1 phage-related baseplate assembly protein [Novosphingobium sp. ST904]